MAEQRGAVEFCCEGHYLVLECICLHWHTVLAILTMLVLTAECGISVKLTWYIYAITHIGGR